MTATPDQPLKRILLIVPWFGPWPAWMPFFLATCAANPTVNWLIPTDQAPPANLPSNVAVETTPLLAYRDRVAARTGVPLAWSDAYKVCDLKPLLGHIHDDRVEGYDYWGFGDIDVIYGNIRAIYTADVLVHDVISTHEAIVAGHLALVRNTQALRLAYTRVWCWKDAIADPSPRSFDETHFSRLFLARRGMRWRDRVRYPNVADGLFVERYSTDLRPLKWIDGSDCYPSVWTWDRGRLTADTSGAREFLYLHFTHWNSARWSGAAQAPWKRLAKLVDGPVDPVPSRFTISAAGIATR